MWSRLWSLIVQPDPTIWAGIIGLGGAIFAGWLGGVIGGRRAVKAALLGAAKAHEDNMRLGAAATLAQAIGFVQAVRTEFDVLNSFVQLYIAPAIAQITDKKPLDARFVLSEDYFTIYRANANLLGNVDDADVRDAIVRAYLKAQAFIDTIRTNNLLVEEDSQSKINFQAEPSPMAGTMRLKVTELTLQTFAHGVVNTYLEYLDAHAKFIDRTQTWLMRMDLKRSSEQALRAGVRGKRGRIAVAASWQALASALALDLS